jgi:hypothetical protein
MVGWISLKARTLLCGENHFDEGHFDEGLNNLTSLIYW